MRNDSLQEFIKLRRQLAEEKASIEKRLQQINEALGEMSAPSAPAEKPAQASPSGNQGGGKRQMSADARARIAEAQRRRWAAQKGQSGSSTKAGNSGGSNGAPKRKMSAAGRRAISEAAKRRWAQAKASGQNKL